MALDSQPTANHELSPDAMKERCDQIPADFLAAHLDTDSSRDERRAIECLLIDEVVRLSSALSAGMLGAN